MIKHCFIRMSDDWNVYIADNFLEVLLCKNDEGIPMLLVGNEDDFEISFTGQEAEEKFNALLDVTDRVDFNYLLQLGLKQYG